MSKRAHERRGEEGSEAEPAAVCSATIIDEAAVARVNSQLAGDDWAKRTTDIFSALADPTRLRILQALSLEQLCVCDIATIAGVSQSAASHQLRLLRDRDLVSYQRVGKRAVYRLADEHVRLLLEQGLAHASERS
jgi:ArsR family transcriptional regulator, lead/cadmium/zinc/bismuth-responsive transcriptional repressor